VTCSPDVVRCGCSCCGTGEICVAGQCMPGIG
jgi:hypothetical protein